MRFVLTFDDGPVGEPFAGTPETNTTKIILNKLLAKGAKAAFFVITNRPNADAEEKVQALIKLEDKQGHVIGIHGGGTGNHLHHTTRVVLQIDKNSTVAYDFGNEGDFPGADDDTLPDFDPIIEPTRINTEALALDSDIWFAKQMIISLTGKTPKFIRPPFWRVDRLVLFVYERNKLLWIDRDVWTKDTGLKASNKFFKIIRETTNSPKKIKARIEKSVGENIKKKIFDMIISLHDTNPETAENLEGYMATAVEAAKKAGISEECIKFTDSRKEIEEILEAKSKNQKLKPGRGGTE